MPKINRCGQARIWDDLDLTRLIKNISNPRHKLIIDLLQYTGERIGAIVQLDVSDVYEDPSSKKVRSVILFRAKTRKGNNQGKRESRQLPIHHALKHSLEQFSPPETGYLFASPTSPGQHITVASVDRWFRVALEKAGLICRGYSLHSFRRTCLTNLRKKGVDVKMIQKFSGHKSLDSLQRYLDCDEGELSKTVELL